MAVFYLDASALLKRYRTEKGTEIVDDIYDGRGEQHLILTSQLTCVEVESVAARARKAGILNDHQYKTLLGAFSRDLAEGIRIMAIGPERLVEAAEIVREVPLRSLDAIHPEDDQPMTEQAGPNGGPPLHTHTVEEAHVVLSGRVRYVIGSARGPFRNDGSVA